MFSLICLGSREQQSYSEGETDRSARTGDSETLKNSEIEDLRILMFENDSTLNDELSDLDDRFFTYRSTSKNNIDRLKKENKALKIRIDELELKLNQLEAQSKEDKDK